MSGLDIEVDTDFSGTIGEYFGQPIGVSWFVESYRPDGGTTLERGMPVAKYTLRLLIRPDGAVGFSGFDYTTEFNAVRVIESGREIHSVPDSVWTASHPEYRDIPVWGYAFEHLAQLQPGKSAIFYVSPAGEGSNFGTLLSSPGAERPVFGRMLQTQWERPEFTGRPADPVLEVDVYEVRSSKSCIRVLDKAEHAFGAFPMFVSGTLTVDAVEEELSRSYSTFGRSAVRRETGAGIGDDYAGGTIGFSCDEDKGRKFSYSAIFSNGFGSSEIAELEFKSLGAATPEEIYEARIAPLVSGCRSGLSIDEFTESGCGHARIRVFQSDLNTGPCAFLGYWDDANGKQRIGIFRFCDAFQEGSFQEGKRYNLYVRNTGPETYVNTLGTENRVLGFRILAEKR